MKKSVLFIFTLCIFSSSFGATTWYLITGGTQASPTSINTAANWKSARDGSGTSPASVGALVVGDVYVIQTNAVGKSTSTVTFNVKLQVENGGTLQQSSNITIAAGVTFQLDNGSYFVQNSSSASNIMGGTESFAVNSNWVQINTGLPTTTNLSGGFGNYIDSTLSSITNGSGTMPNINGNLILNNSGTKAFRFIGNNTSTSITIGGDIIIYQGELDLSSGTGAITVNLGGNLIMSGGTLNNSGGTTCAINFTKAGTATFSKTAGTMSAVPINYTVNSGCTLDFGTSILNGSTGTFTLASGAGIKIGSPSGIAISGATGNVQVGGTRTYNANATYEFNGSAAQITGTGLPASIQNLIINNSFVTAPQVTLSQAVAVTGTFTPTLGTLATGGLLTLKSTSIANTAIVGVAAAANQVTGNVTIERFIPLGYRAFRFLTPGVTTSTSINANWQNGGVATAGIGTHITGSTAGLNGLDATPSGAPSMFTLDDGSGNWTAVAATDGSNILQAGRGYRILIRGDRSVDITSASAANMNVATTLKATGTLITGPVTMGYSSNGGNTAGMPNLSTSTSGNARFTLIGNPYYSPVDWNALSRTGVGATYYAWDANMTGANNRGAYVSWNATTGFNNLGNTGTSNVNQYIQPGQAVFVESLTATPVLTFAEANKNTSLTAVLRTQNQYANMSILLFKPSELATGKPTDGTTIVFDNAFAAGMDAGDASKFVNPDENIAVVRNAANLSIEARPKVTAYDTVYLRLWQLVAGNSYALKINAGNFVGTDAWIKDNYLNTSTPIDLTNGGMVNFATSNTVAASYAENRFSIVFRNSGTLPLGLLNVTAAQKNAGIEVSWSTSNEVGMSGYDIEESSDGISFTKATTVAANNGTSNSYAWFDATIVNGDNFYRIKSIEKNGTVRYSNIVKVKIGGNKAEFTVYPNPVKGGIVNFQMNNVEKGTYTVRFFNNAGQEMASRTINHNGGSATQTINLGASVASGNYRMQVISNGTALATKAVIVE